MAQPDQDEWGIRVETAPGPSFLSLPDVLHYNIASFLSDGSKGNESQDELSVALLGMYGGNLTEMSLRYMEDSSAARLVSLLKEGLKRRFLRWF